ncbi:hypothetical protein KCP69_25800 [Salmonella enterica subsp. enterica]|nr:hypothetical protein KCP69_25800 [Salmonella enterica subsp. enterica]
MAKDGFRAGAGNRRLSFRITRLLMDGASLRAQKQLMRFAHPETFSWAEAVSARRASPQTWYAPAISCPQNAATAQRPALQHSPSGNVVIIPLVSFVYLSAQTQRG